MFILVLFIITKTWKQLKCPLTDEWLKKMWYKYIMEYYSVIKKKKSACNFTVHPPYSKFYILP